MSDRHEIHCGCGRLLGTKSPRYFTAVEIRRRGALIATMWQGEIPCPACGKVYVVGGSRPDVWGTAVGVGSPVET